MLTKQELLALKESAVTFYADGVPMNLKPYQREDHTNAVRKLEELNGLAQLGAHVVEILREPFDMTKHDSPQPSHRRRGPAWRYAEIESAARSLGLLGEEAKP